MQHTTTPTQTREQSEPNRRGTLARVRELVPQRRLSPSDVRHIIERQADRLRVILGVTEALFPIEAVDQIPRIELRADRELPTSAMALWNGTTWVILVNTNESVTRQRFSILHELHHIICHSTARFMFPASERRTADPEHSADLFAASVLMPKRLVKRYWGQGPRSVEAMARRFEVSHPAMTYRLQQLGLTEPTERCAWDQGTYQHRSGRIVQQEAA